MTNLVPLESAAAELFAGEETRARRSESLADSLRDRFGAQAVVNARLLRRGSRAGDFK
jgi:DNA polymerase-4